jgi:hypothetical protein
VASVSQWMCGTAVSEHMTLLRSWMVQGIARQRQAIVNGLRESVVQFSEQVNDISR